MNNFKKIIYILSCFFIITFFISSIFGEDKFSVEYPTKVINNKVFEITLHIDPSIGQYANYIGFVDNIEKLFLFDSEGLDKRFASCDLELIPYNGSSTVKLKVYASKDFTYEPYTPQNITSRITLLRFDSKKKITSLLKLHNKDEDGNLCGIFNYPIKCSSENFTQYGLQLVELRFKQRLFPRKVEISLPNDAKVEESSSDEESSYIKAGKRVIYSNPEGLISGLPPYYSLDFSYLDYPKDKNYVYSKIFEIPRSYDEFKAYFDKNVKKEFFENSKILDLPKDVLDHFNAENGFYIYRLNSFHAEEVKDPKEIYYSLNLMALIFPKDSISVSKILFTHEDITDSYFKDEVVKGFFSVIKNINIAKIPIITISNKSSLNWNKDVLKMLVGQGFQTEKQDQITKKNISSKIFNINFVGSKEKTIWNRGRFNVKDADAFKILINIDGTALDQDGKKIDNYDNAKLFKNVKLVSEILGSNESQIGLYNSLSKKDLRGIDSDLVTVEVRGKGPRLYKGFYKPNEFIRFYLEWRGIKVSNELLFKVHIKDASPNILLNKPTLQVQDGNKRVVKFKIEDPDKSKLTCSIMIPTDLAIRNNLPYPLLEYKDKKSAFIKFDCKDADKISFVFNAPQLGNFNMNNEIDALSMWKMQKGTMIGLATDLVGFGVDKRLRSLEQSESLNRVMGEFTNDKEMLANAKQLKSAMNTLETANKLSSESQNVIKLTQISKNKEDLKKDYERADKTSKKGWLEWGADLGILGVNVAQSTVGAIAMLPGKVPVLGPLGKKVGGAFSITFNLMTNVWKGNFEYLSKAEKINRAKEMIFPYPIIITVTDEDGFETKTIQNMMVVFNWLN